MWKLSIWRHAGLISESVAVNADFATILVYTAGKFLFLGMHPGRLPADSKMAGMDPHYRFKLSNAELTYGLAIPTIEVCVYAALVTLDCVLLCLVWLAVAA